MNSGKQKKRFAERLTKKYITNIIPQKGLSMFEEMMAELNVQIRGMILENTKDFISMEGQFPILMTRKETAKLLGIGVNSFDDHYRYPPEMNFPKPDEMGRWNKFEVIEYFKKGVK